MLWYSDTIWLVLHVSGSPAGLALAPFFSFCALVAALAVQTRLAWAVWDVHLELQEEGFEGEGGWGAGARQPTDGDGCMDGPLQWQGQRLATVGRS